jgi:peptidoglycan/xylan/chitin deacetylase (PgdA/CDA1 family)
MPAISRLPPVLMYHSVTRSGGKLTPLSVSRERFASQMLYLQRRKLRGVSMRELHRAMIASDATGLVGVTFDDGYEDFLENALSVLQSLGFSATVFMVAGMLGEENSWEHHGESRPRLRLLDAGGVREVAEQGMEVGSHTMSHPRLSSLDAQALERELNESRQTLGEVTGERVAGLCYPYGNLSPAAARAAREAGYAYACAAKKRVEGSVYDWPRIFVGQKDTPVKLWTKLKIYTPYSKFARHLRPNLRA